MNIQVLISKVEERRLSSLFKMCQQTFSRVHLPSHDEWHHLRVWGYARQLIEYLSAKGLPITEKEVDGLIVAVFFHDQGMSISSAKEHGFFSRQICEKYFSTIEVEHPDNYEEVLKVIEFHDRKSYFEGSELAEQFLGNEALLKLLNVSDDLDAYGLVGVYRYAEIYLMRNVEVEELGELVIRNLKSRFELFQHIFQSDNSFFRLHVERYNQTLAFYTNLKTQLEIQGYADTIREGSIGIVNCILRDMIRGRMALLEFVKPVSTDDIFVAQFKERLNAELREWKFRISG